MPSAGWAGSPSSTPGSRDPAGLAPLPWGCHSEAWQLRGADILMTSALRRKALPGRLWSWQGHGSKSEAPVGAHIGCGPPVGFGLDAVALSLKTKN